VLAREKKRVTPNFIVLGTGDTIATTKEHALLPLMKRERLWSPGLFDISITADEVSDLRLEPRHEELKSNVVTMHVHDQ
jgi:hypothetical protein